MMYKTEHLHQDLFFALDMLAFTLGAVRLCLQDERIDETQVLLQLAAKKIYPHLSNEDVYDLDQPLSDHVHATFRSCCSSLFVYRALVLYLTSKPVELLALLESTEQEQLELDDFQCDVLLRTCFNVGLSAFHREDYKATVTWMNLARSFGKATFVF